MLAAVGGASADVPVSQLMDRECYRDIEKIKTIGSTYMAAVGLVPTTSSQVRAAPPTSSQTPPRSAGKTRRVNFQAKKSVAAHLCTVSDFAIDMFDVLDAINYQSYNDFVLRVGEWRERRRSLALAAGKRPGNA